jgi:hypothetical protein
MYSTPNVIRVIKCRRMRWAGHVARTGYGRGEEKIPLGRPRRRWEDYVKLALEKVGWESMAWIYLTQDRDRWRALVNAVMSFRVPKYGEFLDCLRTSSLRRSCAYKIICE